jgi:hypothetical protein
MSDVLMIARKPTLMVEGCRCLNSARRGGVHGRIWMTLRWCGCPDDPEVACAYGLDDPGLDDPEVWMMYTQHRKQSFHTIESDNKE